MASRLPRSAPHPYNQPVSPSVSPKSYTSIRPLSPDAYELKKENEGLKKENEGLKKFLYQLNMQLSEEQNKSRRLEYRELLRKALQNEVLAAKGPGAAELRRKIIEDVNNDEKKTIMKQYLVQLLQKLTSEKWMKIKEVVEERAGGIKEVVEIVAGIKEVVEIVEERQIELGRRDNFIYILKLFL